MLLHHRDGKMDERVARTRPWSRDGPPGGRSFTGTPVTMDLGWTAR